MLLPLLTFPLFIFLLPPKIYIYNFSWFILTNKHSPPPPASLNSMVKVYCSFVEAQTLPNTNLQKNTTISVLFVTWIFNLTVENTKSQNKQSFLHSNLEILILHRTTNLDQKTGNFTNEIIITTTIFFQFQCQ